MKRCNVHRALLRVAVSVLAACPITAARAGVATYPGQPVRFLVGYAPGGANDILARVVAQALSERLGQQFIVDNRPGGAGIVANSIAANADPNGYTIVLVSPTFTYEASLHKKLPYDAAAAFVPLSLLAQSPFVLLTGNASRAKTIQDLISWAKTSPSQINYAHAGPGSFIHLVIALFASMARIDMTGVAYKGSGPAVAALMSGEVQLLATSVLPSLANIRAGRLRALAVTSVERAPLLPNVPTVAESGVSAYEAKGWWGVVVRKGTHQDIIDRLSRAIAQVMSAPELLNNLAQQGVESIGSSPARFGAHLRAESAKWKQVIQESNIAMN